MPRIMLYAPWEVHPDLLPPGPVEFDGEQLSADHYSLDTIRLTQIVCNGGALTLARNIKGVGFR